MSLTRTQIRSFKIHHATIDFKSRSARRGVLRMTRHSTMREHFQRKGAKAPRRKAVFSLCDGSTPLLSANIVTFREDL